MFLCYAVDCQPAHLYLGHIPAQVDCHRLRRGANKRDQRFILSHQGHLSFDGAREWSGRLHEAHTSLNLGYQLKPNQCAIKD